MKRFKRLFTAVLLSGAAVMAHAQTELQTYVKRCQDELLFAPGDVKQMNCNDGPQFAQGTRDPVHDLVVHQRINADVDMVAACRWGDGIPFKGGNTKFLSIELLIHNRVNGGTCFFAAKDVGSTPTKPVSSVIVPVTNFSTTNRPNANDYWLTPSQMNGKELLSNAIPGNSTYKEKLQCVRCHSQGPYIASMRIAPFLASFGLLNDGHDTHSAFAGTGSYFVVGSRDHTQSNPGSHPLGNWNYLIAQNNFTKATNPCSSACHVLAKVEAAGSFAPIGDLTAPNDPAAVVLPSIKKDIGDLVGSGGMEPGAEDSAYRWINRDIPGSDGVEIETFTASKQKFPVSKYQCGAPSWIEASAVGSGSTFSTQSMSMLQNKLRSFSLRDGLVCLHADQPSGRCNDYQLSYKCPTGEPKWVGPYNKDMNLSDDGDREERKAWSEARAACDNKDPIAMRADVLWSGGIVMTVAAPNDRLAQFNGSGLVCRNADQGSGQSCSSYTVRYRGCRSDANLARIKNAWVNPPTFGDRYLTTTNNTDGAETRAQGNNFQFPSQDWTIEYLPGGNVRLADVWSGKYLTASSNSDQATVLVRNLDFSLQRQLWIIETISGSSEVRFRNVGSNRYLTVGNYTSDPYYAPMLSQSLSNQNWASQRWLIQ